LETFGWQTTTGAWLYHDHSICGRIRRRPPTTVNVSQTGCDWSLVDEGEQSHKKQMLAEAEKVAPIKVRPDERDPLLNPAFHRRLLTFSTSRFARGFECMKSP